MLRTTPLLFAPLLLCACFGLGPAPEGRNANECRDGADNDGDGLSDCDDPDCAGSLQCEEGDAETDTDSDNDADPCGVVVQDTWPEANNRDFYYRSDIEFELSDRDPRMDPLISLVGPAGAIAGGTFTSDDEETIYFSPTEPLELVTTYQATLTWCGGTAELGFTTSDLGAPLSVSLAGRTYATDIAAARVLEPTGMEFPFDQFFNETLLLQVESTSSTYLWSMAALADEFGSSVQDMCLATFVTPIADFSDSPWFEVGPMDLAVNSDGGVITYYDTRASGTFAADGSSFGGGEFEAVLDTRELAQLVEYSGAEMCDMAISLNLSCEPCGNDGQPCCLPLKLDHITGDQVRGLDLEALEPGQDCPDCAEPVRGCGAASGCASTGRQRVLPMALLLVVVGLVRRRKDPHGA